MGTVAKTASLSSYILSTGGTVSVKFTNGNTASNPTLNINSEGAKAIYYNGAALTDTTLIQAGDIVTFIYSSYYHIISIDKAGVMKTAITDSKTLNPLGGFTAITGLTIDGYSITPSVTRFTLPEDKDTTYTLESFGITATNTELNKLDGCTATTAELNCLGGIDSNIQDQLDGKLAVGGTAVKADLATKAEKDSYGSTIKVSDYETKSDAAGKLTEAKEYTNTAITNLVNAAPETLNTLGELADAIENNQTVNDITLLYKICSVFL